MGTSQNFKVNKGIDIGIPNGTAPITTNSTTLVTNLNADLLDGQHGAYYNSFTNTTNKPTTLSGYGITDTYTAVDIDAKDAVYRSTEFAISGSINKLSRTSAITFQETTANQLVANAEKKYFKSLDKIVSPATTTIKFPQAPTATNLITNGTFDTDVSSWAQYGSSTIGWNPTGAIDLNNNTTESGCYTAINVVAGKKYKIEANILACPGGTSTTKLMVGTSPGNPNISYASMSTTGYITTEFIAPTTGTVLAMIQGANTGLFTIDNVSVFAATDLLRYDNLLLKDDGTYVITQTEQNQYIDMDTMLNYTSTVYNVADGSSTGTSITFTYGMTNEEYSGSDGHKYLTIGATARFNRGAYHPVFNPYGTGTYLNTAGTDGTAMYWYKADSRQAYNIADTFRLPNVGDIYPFETGIIAPLTGGYLDGPNNNGRPDNKFYDIIYNELWIDQRWRAEYVDGTKERTTIERDKDISSSQYADFVGSATWETKGLINTTISGVNTYTYPIGLCTYIDVSSSVGYTVGNVNALDIGNEMYIKGNSKYYKCATISPNQIVILPIYGNVSSDFTVSSQTTVVYAKQSNLRYGSTTYLHTDIIGNPANYPTVWIDALAGGGSIAGAPLLVGENGENYSSILTSGSYPPVKLSKKISQNNFQIILLSITDTYNIDVSQSASTSNTIIVDATGVKKLELAQYQAYNNNLLPIANSKVVSGSAGVSDVEFTGYYDNSYGQGILIKLITKVAVNSVWNDVNKPYGNVNFTALPFNNYANSFNLNSIVTNSMPTHDAISLYSSTSPAVKTFSYLTQNTRAKQCYVFKEMKYDAIGVNQDGTPTNTWGDNNKFDIVDNVSTITDNNGNTCLVGQKARLVDFRVKE